LGHHLLHLHLQEEIDLRGYFPPLLDLQELRETLD